MCLGWTEMRWPRWVSALCFLYSRFLFILPFEFTFFKWKYSSSQMQMCSCLHIDIHQIWSCPISQREREASPFCLACYVKIPPTFHHSQMWLCSSPCLTLETWLLPCWFNSWPPESWCSVFRPASYYIFFQLSLVWCQREDFSQMLKRFFHSSYLMCLIWHKPQAAHDGLVEKGPCFEFFWRMTSSCIRSLLVIWV